MMSRIGLLVVVVAVIVALAVPFGLPTFYVSLLTKMIIFALFAMSLDLLLGYAGLPSLGHAAFFGVAAYAAGIVAVRAGLNPWLSLVVGVVIGTLLGVVLGFLSLRLRGSYFLMITLAFAQVLWAIALGWRSMTGGDDGLANVPSLVSSGPPPFDQTNLIYLIVTTIVGISGVVLLLIARSPFGYALQGIRESETRMLALGYDVWLYKYCAFILASAFTALAGALYTFYNMCVGLDSLNIVRSAEVLLMVVLGGAGTLLGPALGAALIVFLESFISSYTRHWLLCMGLIYVVSTLCAPQGLVGLFRKFHRRADP
jgi:branched-chain amino acid transport system permease protein